MRKNHKPDNRYNGPPKVIRRHIQRHYYVAWASEMAKCAGHDFEEIKAKIATEPGLKTLLFSLEAQIRFLARQIVIHSDLN